MDVTRRRDRWWNADSLAEVLLSNSVRDGECLVWQGKQRSAKSKYGRVSYRGTVYSVHRASYVTWNGSIPDGMHVHHRCGNPKCIEPSHLGVVHPSEHAGVIHLETIRENIVIAQKAAAQKCRSITHCKHGHELTPENVWVRKEGWRTCRACNRERMRARKRRAFAA